MDRFSLVWGYLLSRAAVTSSGVILSLEFSLSAMICLSRIFNVAGHQNSGSIRPDQGPMPSWFSRVHRMRIL